MRCDAAWPHMVSLSNHGLSNREWRAQPRDVRALANETGAAKTLTCTPGHHFLDEFGQFPTIAEMLLRGGGVARIVMEDGSVRTVTGKRIVWSEQNAHLYGGRARQAGWTDGSVALAEAEVDGWQTTDFEVEDFHTYVAEGTIHLNQGFTGVFGRTRFATSETQANLLVV